MTQAGTRDLKRRLRDVLLEDSHTVERHGARIVVNVRGKRFEFHRDALRNLEEVVEQVRRSLGDD